MITQGYTKDKQLINIRCIQTGNGAIVLIYNPLTKDKIMIKYICINNYQLFIMISKKCVRKDKRYENHCVQTCETAEMVRKQHKRQLRGLQKKEEKR